MATGVIQWVHHHTFKDNYSYPEQVSPNLFGIALGTFNLTCFEPDVFDGLVTMKTINFNTESTYDLPIGLFDGLTNLESVQFTGENGGGLSSLPTNLFQGLKKLKTIDLSLNQINFDADIHPRTFAGLKSLVSLKISGTLGIPADYANKNQNIIRKYCGCNVVINTA
jgi:hypothetical protein